MDWLLDRLGHGLGRPLLELAAGTGKLSEALLARIEASSMDAGDLTVLEPVAEMRAVFARCLPDVPLLDGRAEAIPLADGSVAAVVVGQAFHWFDGPAALAEIHRVLAPGGALGLIWNARDYEFGWVRALGEIVHAHVGNAPTYASGAWRAAFEATPLFGPLEEGRFSQVQRMDAEAIVTRVASVSYIAALPEDAHREVCDAIRRLLAEHPETRGRDVFDFPDRVDTFVCRRLE